MTKQEQIEEMGQIIVNNGCDLLKSVNALYDAGYRKTFTSDMATDTQKAYKEGYLKSYDDIIFLVKKAIIANARANVWTDTMVMDMDDVDNIAEEVAEQIGGLNNDE